MQNATPLSLPLSHSMCPSLSPPSPPPPPPSSLPPSSLSLSLPHSVLPFHASALSLLSLLHSPFPLPLQVCVPTLRA